MAELIVPGLIGVVSAFLAAFLTARWTVWQFHLEKWWERKERAYTEVTDALLEALRYCEVMVAEYEGDVELTDERRHEMGEAFGHAIRGIRKATLLGTFVLSDEAWQALRDLELRPRPDFREIDPYTYYDSEAANYREALEHIVQAGKADLRAEMPRLWRGMFLGLWRRSRPVGPRGARRAKAAAQGPGEAAKSM